MKELETPFGSASNDESKPFLSNIGRGGDDEDDSKASMLASVFNLVNNVAGAGILTLSAAMASGTGWIPAILISAVLGLLSAHCFAIIGSACELTGESDFKVHLLPISLKSSEWDFFSS